MGSSIPSKYLVAIIPDSSFQPFPISSLPVPSPTPNIRIAYQEAHPKPPSNDDIPPPTDQDTILLLHGFPQTSYQYRHVLSPLAGSGYHVLAPDYRGAGYSSKPTPAANAFTKTTMASDMLYLLEHLRVISRDENGHAYLATRLHVVGHDIGGMIAYALAATYPTLLTTLTYGECPIPGTQNYHRNLQPSHDPALSQFHFLFHAIPDLPETLVQGHERAYLAHFFDKLSHNRAAVSEADLDFYESMYARPGGMRCGFEVYRAFAKDAVEYRERRERGKTTDSERKLPVLALNGECSRHAEEARDMFSEAHGSEDAEVEFTVVHGAGHYIAEESPEDFVKKVLDFVGRRF